MHQDSKYKGLDILRERGERGDGTNLLYDHKIHTARERLRTQWTDNIENILNTPVGGQLIDFIQAHTHI